MRSKVLVSVLVAICMLFAFGIVKNAQADQLLFPWIVKSTSVSTIISVVNTSGSNLGWNYQGVDQLLHYQYWYKLTTANGQTEGCTNQSFKRPTSKDDLVIFDASANISDGKPLFGDTVRYGDQSFKLSAEGPRRAFLIVDNDTPYYTLNSINADGTLYGEAMVLEIAGGAAWGYIAYNASGGGESSRQQTSPVNMSDGLDLLGEVLGGKAVGTDIIPGAVNDVEALGRRGQGEVTPVVILPATALGANFITKFFTTPIDNAGTPANATGGFGNDNGALDQRTGNANAKIQFIYNPTDGEFYGGLFDDDEKPIDFNKSKNIVCTSADSLRDLMTEGAFNDFAATQGPGWTMIDIQTGDLDANANLKLDNPTDDMIVGKLEYTTGGATFDSYTMGGTFNNFNWIRNSQTVAGDGGINNVRNHYPPFTP
jgi:hypothetical protein